MISDYFKAPQALERMRSGCAGPHVDGFARALAEAGYSPHTIRGYVRAAVHLGRWADRRGIAIGCRSLATTKICVLPKRCAAGLVVGTATLSRQHRTVLVSPTDLTPCSERTPPYVPCMWRSVPCAWPMARGERAAHAPRRVVVTEVGRGARPDSANRRSDFVAEVIIPSAKMQRIEMLRS